MIVYNSELETVQNMSYYELNALKAYYERLIESTPIKEYIDDLKIINICLTQTV